MIAPTNRLLLWVAIFLPFLALGAMVPAAGGLSMLVLCLLVVAVIVDAGISMGRTASISVSLPEVVRLSNNREGEITITISNRDRVHKAVTLGLPLPDEIQTKVSELNVNMKGETDLFRVGWPCVPTERGSYFLDSCYYQVPSFCGFWNIRGKSACRSELRVYPDLLHDRKRLASIFMNRGTFGIHSQRMIGQGRDFEKLRNYVPGDSFDDIHWKATAKRGRPITKLYQVEKTQEIYVVIDSSRLSARQAGGEAVLEKFLTSALVLGLVAERQGDLFGVIAFDDKVRKFVRASGGKAHFNACREVLYSVEPSMVSPDFDELAAFIKLKIRRRALLLILTDLSDPVLADNFINRVDLFCRQHLVMVSMIKQPGAESVFSSGDAECKDDLYMKLGGHMFWHKLREIEKTLLHRGIKLMMVENEKLSAEMVAQYMNVKTRQLL